MVKQLINLLSSNGYAIGLGVEAAIALIAGVLLILLLANAFAKRERAAEGESEAVGSVVEDGEPVAVVAEESPVEIIREINTVYVPVMSEQAAEPAPEPTPEPVAEPVVEAEKPAEANTQQQQQQPIIINVFGNEAEKPQEPAPAPSETVVVVEGDGVKFHENKTIEELYEELSVEQRSFFDELKNTALAKPNAVLSITKTYENIKIGKRSIIKLLIRRGVTVAEFILENDALKEYRLSSQNKKGKSKIKIRPTVIAVTELDTLRAAVDMIHLAYEQIIEE